MAKKKKGLQIDFKELGLKYGDRVGLAVAVVLALLFILWGFSGVVSNPLTAQTVKSMRDEASTHMRNFAVQPEALEPANTLKEVKRPEDIVKLSESKKKPIAIGMLSTLFSWYYQPPKEDISRSNPDVLLVLKMKGKPCDYAFKIDDIRGDKVLIAVPGEGVKIERKAPGNKKPGQVRNAPGDGSMTMPPPGNAFSNDPGNAAAPPSTTRKNWTAKLIPAASLKDEDLIAVNIWPSRAAYVAGVFPYARQVDELAQKLKIDRNEVESYFADLQVQRRELILKGARLPDGSLATRDYVLIPDPADPGKRLTMPYTEVPQSPSRPEEARAAGWRDLDMAGQNALTNLSTEKWIEPDPVARSLIALGGRLNRRLPRPLRGDYPAIFNELEELKDLIEKIKKENTPIPQPRSDPRLDRDNNNQFEGEAPSAGPGNSNARGATSPGQPSSGPTMGVTGNQPPPQTAPPPPSGGPGKAFDGIPGMSGTKPPAPGTSPTNVETAAKVSGIPDYCIVRFVDLTLADERVPVGGRTFEYRVRVVMNNPNYQRGDVAVPEFARDKELFGNWNQPTQVSFPEGEALFADERQRDPKRTGPDSTDLDKVPVQVHKWLGFFDAELGAARDPERMGDWWVDRVLASRGEFIGRVPTHPRLGETELVIWLPAVPEDNDANRMGSEALEKCRTPALATRSLLVDFEGGARIRQKRLGKAGMDDEDVPAELLIALPDGRLVARSLLQDREEATRKQRFDRWWGWVKPLKDRAAPPKVEEPKKDDKAPPKGKSALP